MWIEKEYAWLPTKMSSDKIIWLKDYYAVGELNRFVDDSYWWDVYYTSIYKQCCINFKEKHES